VALRVSVATYQPPSLPQEGAGRAGALWAQVAGDVWSLFVISFPVNGEGGGDVGQSERGRQRRRRGAGRAPGRGGNRGGRVEDAVGMRLELRLSVPP